MKNMKYIAILVVLIAAVSATKPAFADHDCTPNTGSSWPAANGCSSSFRIHAGDDCLSYTHNSWTGDYTIKSACTDQGNLQVHVDRVAARDVMACFGSASFSGWSEHLIRKFACCLENPGDLCFKDQVAKNSENKIRHVKRSGTTITTNTYVDVSTHWKRYDFCQSNSTYVYCEVNPSGDATTRPSTPRCSDDSSCNCGDHHCTVADCDAEWDKEFQITKLCGSSTDTNNSYSSSIDATDGTGQECTFTAECITSNYGRWDGTQFVQVQRRKSFTLTADVDEIGDYSFCHTTAYTGFTTDRLSHC